MGKTVTKKYTLMRGNFNLRDPETGRTIRQQHGAVIDLNENQARAFADLFEPVGAGFDGVVNVAPVTPAPRPQPSQPEPKPEPEDDQPGPDAPLPELNANKYTAKEMIAMMTDATTAEQVEGLAEAEQARSKPRPSVLTAADRAIDALCIIEPS